MGTRMTSGAGKLAVRAPTQDGELVAHLVHGGPDVVEELDFDDGLEAPHRHADGPADDIGLGERRVPDAIVAELQSGGQR